MNDVGTDGVGDIDRRGLSTGPVMWVVSVTVFVIAVALVFNTVSSTLESDLSADGGALWDFRDASYYSVTAWLDGLIPYDHAAYFAAYPVAQEFGLLPPTYLVAHLPFQLLAFPSAATAMFAINLIGSVALVAWALRIARYRATPMEILLVASVLIVSNAGRNAIVTGQSALLFAAGTYAALTASSAAAGSVGMFIAMMKPSFGLPVAVLVAAGGRLRRVVIGVGAAALVSAILIVPMIGTAGGLGPLMDIFRANVAYSADSQWIDLATTTSRVDVTATIAMLTNVDLGTVGEIVLGLVVLAVAAWAVHRRKALMSAGPRDAAIVVICVATLICIYHSFYDVVLLTLPLVLTARRDFAGGIRPAVRWILFVALAVAWLNPLRLDSVIWRLTDSLDVAQFLGPGVAGLGLLVAFVTAIVALHEAQDLRVSGHSVQQSIDSVQSRTVPYDGA